MPISWNIPLVLLSVLVAMIGSFTALTHAQRMRESEGRRSWVWLLTGGFTLGVAIWTMHFIGMLAFHLPTQIAYDIPLTLLSVVPAIAAALLDFHLLRTPELRMGRIAGGSVLMGLGISAMHYTGMAALKMSPPINYSMPVVALSVLIAISAALGALLIVYASEKNGWNYWLRYVAGGVIMGLAISGMHYTAMAAAEFPVGSICLSGASRIEPELLALWVSMGALFLFAGGVLATLFDQRMVWQKSQALEQLQAAHAELEQRAQHMAETMTRELRESHDMLNHDIAQRKQMGLQLAASELQLRTIIETEPECVKLIAEDGTVLQMNPAGLRMLEADTPEQIIGQKALGIVAPHHRQAFVALMRRVFEGESGHLEFEAVGLKGTHCWMETYEVPMRDAQGKITAMLGITRDITERQRIQRETETLLRRYQTLMKTALDGIRVMDIQGNIVEANDSFCDMLGYTQEEVTQLNIADWDAQWSKEELLERLKAFVGKSGARFETVQRRKDGTLIDVEVSTTGVEIDGQRYFFASSRDITGRKRIEQKNEVLMRRHQALMKSALEGIHIMDMQGNIVEANDAFCHMLGYTQEEMANLNVADWDAQWSREELMERFKKLIRIGGMLFETRHRRKDGTVIDVEVSTTGAEIDGHYYLYASSRDITERKKVEQELRDSEQKSRMLMDSAADAVFVADPLTERWVYINDRFESLLGYSRAELLAGNIYDLVTHAFRDIYRERFQSIAQSGGVSTRELQLNRKDGSSVPLEMNAVTLPDGTVYGSCRDITERKKIEEGQRIAAVTFDTQEAIMITTPDAKILRVNQAFQEITGYRAEEVIGQNPRMFQSGRHDAAFYQVMWSALLNTGKWSGEVWDRRKDGSIYPKLMTITAVYDDNHQMTHYVAVFRDITMRKKSEQEIHRLAFYDSLTMLPNRRLMLDRLQQALAVSARNGRHGALLFLDLDHFKTINDTQGHAMGDQLLIEVARRLQTCVREGDSVARLGGDEFVVVLEDMSSEADEAATQTELVAEKIRSELGRPYLLKDYECLSTASIGISLFSGHPESAEDLLQHADVAMYQAKTGGRNAIRFFDPRMQTALEVRAALEADLRYALEKQQFRLYYQIQVDSLRRPLGAEVLLRWEHPERGLVAPEHFIPTAEETGLIVPIGLWVLQSACAQLKEWQNDALTRDLTLAVNVSAKQFRQADFVAQAQRVLLESGAKPSHLKLEFTESTVLENVEDTISKMRELKILGVGFSMDDFGTGYSSLQYLKRLPLDQIKIDQSFVRDIVSDPNDAAIVQTIIAMTEALGLNVIAEGVETEAQREFLDLHGCHAFQGFLFGKPMTVKRFKGLL